MRNSFLWFATGLFLGVCSFGAVAQDAPDSCVRQGLLPGSAAYYACLTASQDSMHGMFDPLKPEDSESQGDASGSGAMSTTDPDDPLIDLDPLNSDPGRSGRGMAGWHWSTRK